MVRREKIIKSLSKLEPYMTVLIPHRIAHRCILRAKTDESKKRLVEASIWIATEDMRQLWSTELRRFVPKPRTPKKNSFISFLKSLRG